MHTFLTRALRTVVLVVVSMTSLAAQQAPASAPPAQTTMPGYVIGASDVLRVTVYTGAGSNPDFRLQDYTVQTNGSVALPLMKPITLAGLTVTAASAAVRKALIDGGQFEDCTVDIVVVDYHSQNIKVQGAVSKPGNVTIKQLNEGELTDVLLDNGDTIDVPVAPRFYVQGFVNSPGDLQWEPNMTLQKAIFKAGGATKDGALNRVSVKRLDPKTKKYDEQDLGKDSMAFIIQPDDVIYVPKKRM